MYQQIGFQQLLNQVHNPPKLRIRFTETPDHITLWVYGEIGTETTAEDVVQAVESLPSDRKILVRINSTGGYVHDGLAIYAALKQRGNVTTRIDGIAASAASIIAMAGTPVQVYPHSQIFLHRAVIGVVGNVKALRYATEWLEKVDHSIATIYSEKTGKSLRKVQEYLDGEFDGTIFTAEEAIKVGLADEMLLVDGEADERVVESQPPPFTEMIETPPNDQVALEPGSESIRNDGTVGSIDNLDELLALLLGG